MQIYYTAIYRTLQNIILQVRRCKKLLHRIIALYTIILHVRCNYTKPEISSTSPTPIVTQYNRYNESDDGSCSCINSVSYSFINTLISCSKIGFCLLLLWIYCAEVGLALASIQHTVYMVTHIAVYRKCFERSSKLWLWMIFATCWMIGI